MTLQEETNKLLMKILEELKKLNREGITTYHSYKSYGYSKNKQNKKSKR